VSVCFLIGFGLGLLFAAPLALWAMWRTARRVDRLRERAVAAERLAQMGTLTGGLAHEIKNPLSSINLNVQLLQEDLQQISTGLSLPPAAADQLARSHRRLESLRREVQRLRDILDDFLKFAGRLRLDKAPLDVSAVVAELADFFAPQAEAASLRLRTQLEAQPALVSADAGLLKQAMLNLMLNAAKAMTEAREARKPHGGADELILRTQRARTLGQEEIHIHIIDTGPGIEPDRLQRIFEPYYSTTRGGTGLGLPTARRIVEEHGGALRVHSEPGRGSDFSIVLPALSPT
jgi:signal transduction histidine kinase